MTDYRRIIRQQAIREAEGYLDLSMGLTEQLSLAFELQVQLAERALEALQRAGRSSGKQSHVLYLTGQAYRVMKQYHEAVPSLKAAAELDPDNIFTWLALGWCHKRTNRLDLAIESLERALVAESQEAILHYNLACYWSLAGNAQLAIQYLAQSLTIDPSYRDLVGMESDFDPIRDTPEFQSVTNAIV